MKAFLPGGFIEGWPADKKASLMIGKSRLSLQVANNCSRLLPGSEKTYNLEMFAEFSVLKLVISHPCGLFRHLFHAISSMPTHDRRAIHKSMMSLEKRFALFVTMLWSRFPNVSGGFGASVGTAICSASDVFDGSFRSRQRVLDGL